MRGLLYRVIGGTLAVALTLSMAGCRREEQPARPLSSTLRAIQVGDYYEYTLRGTATKPNLDPEDAVNVSGTTRVSVSEAGFTDAGDRILRIEYLTTLRFEERLLEYRYALRYIQTRNPRDLVLIAYEDETGDVSPITPPIVALPGQWYAGYSRAYNVPFVYSFIIIRSEPIQVPLGKFTAWRCQVRSQLREDDPIESATRTVWYAPELGVPVAVQLHTSIRVGSDEWILSLQQLLRFTTVPIPETSL